MKREPRVIAQWTSGFGILLRLVFLSILANIIVLPVAVLDMLMEPGTTAANVVAGLYLVIIIPLALPEMTRICGFQIMKVDEIDGSGGMNEASKRKMLELRAERERGITDSRMSE
ncbi:MAG: hypothetical protein O3A87_05525 [Verrucomicrobia bacterium]|nr:hypothetical protein [Verrucomicrobiota bacterium]MDA1005927.1 hypothetical protein [Verrucomicrobiota bacterium]